MKQFRLSVVTLLAAWVLAGSGVAVADGGSGANGVKIEKSDNKKVRIHTAPGAPVDVAVIDADGNVLYRGTIRNQNQRNVLFNLNSLTDGKYFITASNDTWWMSQSVTIRNNVVLLDERNRQQVTQPTLVAYDRNKFEVTLPSTNVAQANVTIYDAQSVPVFSNRFRGQKQRFDLSALPEGTYTMYVGPDEKQFFSRVTVKR